jgi:NADH:ubiquinone oxidoreductase subunit
MLSPAAAGLDGELHMTTRKRVIRSRTSPLWFTAQAILIASLAVAAAATSQTPLSVPADSSRWLLEAKAKVVDYQGRKSILLDGGAATLKDFEMRDGTIDVDVATSAPRGFFGFQFRIAADNANAEEVYLRQHKSGYPDAMQYTPVLNNGRNWQIYNGPGFTGAVDIPKDVWFHLRLEVAGAQARLYVKDMNKPALVMTDLKSDIRKGQVALIDITGATYFSNFEVHPTPDAPWERHLPPMPPDTLTKWSLSPSYDALARDLERPLSGSESAATQWQDVEAEPPGFVVISRYREAPQVHVSFANDFSKRLEPQPGMKLIYARTNIDSDRDQVKRLLIGYSDDVSVFLNGKILWRGRSAQNFRDPAFLGIVNPENDTVYLPLKKGRNELLLAVSELGGGWGFICRLTEMEN